MKVVYINAESDSPYYYMDIPIRYMNDLVYMCETSEYIIYQRFNSYKYNKFGSVLLKLMLLRDMNVYNDIVIVDKTGDIDESIFDPMINLALSIYKNNF